MKIAPLIVSICVAGVLFACGQKGPLVMPDAQKHKRTIPTLPGPANKPANGSGAPKPAPTAAPAPVPTTPAPVPPSPSTPAPPDSTPPP